jgi:ComF family protein
MKYRQDIGLGEVLAVPLAQFFFTLGWQVDLVIPVPLGKKRARQRGFNQAALLAYPFALETGIEYQPRALWRSKETSTQVGLSIAQRRQNVENAFTAEPNRVAGKRVLLLDDVATTGATLSSCARSLLNAAAVDVQALTLARAAKLTGGIYDDSNTV